MEQDSVPVAALPDSPVDGTIGTQPPKTMSPEKAALAAMFDSIQMPAPTSPSKSPRKLALLTSPSKPLLTRGPLVPGRLLAASPASTRPRRAVASNASPSAKLSDMSLMLEPTGTHELLVNDHTLGSDSFLAAGIADVTINDSFDVSRARKKYPTRASTAAQKPAQGLSGLGVGRVVKNAAGDDTIELSSFAAGSTSMMDNLLDESGQNSLLFGNSFSVSKPRAKARKSNGSSGSSSSGEDEEQVKLWNGKLNGASETHITPKVVRRPVSSTGGVPARPAAAAPRRSLLPPTAPGSRVASSTRLPSRSGPITPASSRLLESRGAPKTPAANAHHASEEPVDDGKTPMRQRRKSTFTASRPPVSGPVSRRESLLTAPPLPQTAPKTPGRAGKPKAGSPMSAAKTPGAAVRAIPRPRASLTTAATPRASALPTSSSSSSLSSLSDSTSATRAAGVLPRPRVSLVGRPSAIATRPIAVTDATPKPAARVPRSSILGRSPSSTTARSAEPRTLVPRASVGPGQAPLMARSAAARSLSASAADKVLGEISNVPSSAPAAGVSKIARPRSSIAGPSSAPRVGSFGYRPRPSAAHDA